MPNTSRGFRAVCVILLLLAGSIAVPGSYIATNPLKGCSVDSSNMMLCPGGFSSGAAGGFDSIVLSGATSGAATIVPPAVAGTPTLTTPTMSGTFLVTNAGVAEASATAAANTVPIAGSDGRLSKGYIPFMGVGFVPGAVYQAANSNNTGSGDVDIYTAPGSTRAMLASGSCFNTAGTTTNVFPQVKISGTYYKLSAALSVATVTTGTLTLGALVLEPGEIFSLNTSQAGLNCFVAVIEYPSTVPIYSPKLTSSLAIGNNTIYTVPGGTAALSVGPSFTQTASGTYASSVGATIKWHVVTNGGSPGSTNQSTATTAVGGNNAAALGPFRAGNAGDFVVLNLTAATGTNIAWVTVSEF
jgi:hypothetical protein